MALVRGFAATAIEQEELPADEDPDRLAFELNGIILAADTNFVLQDDPAVLDLARQITGGSGSTAAKTPDRGKAGQVPRPPGVPARYRHGRGQCRAAWKPRRGTRQPKPGPARRLEVSEILLLAGTP